MRGERSEAERERHLRGEQAEAERDLRGERAEADRDVRGERAEADGDVRGERAEVDRDVRGKKGRLFKTLVKLAPTVPSPEFMPVGGHQRNPPTKRPPIKRLYVWELIVPISWTQSSRHR